MSTDPKKNDEVKDEELDKVSGGTPGDTHDPRPLPGDPDISGPEPGMAKK